MNKEIKEILDYLKDDSGSFTVCDVSYYKLSDYKAKVLLDYITKLQRYVDETFLYTYEELQDKVIEKQEKINKAIKYIENNKEKQFAYNYEYYLEDKEVEELLNILKGSEE